MFCVPCLEKRYIAVVASQPDSMQNEAAAPAY